MMSSTLRLLSHVGVAFLALVVGALLLAAVRLSLGPVSVSWLIPHIESALNEAHEDVRFNLGEVDVSWLGWEHLVALRLLDIEAVDDSGSSIANIPAVAISFSRDALREGVFAPETVQIVEPNLWLLRGLDGQMRLAVTEDQVTSEPMVTSLLARLGEPDNPRTPLSYLNEIEVFDATLVYTDQKLGASWQARIASADLLRDPDGILLDVRLETDAAGETATITVQGAYQPNAEFLAARITFADVNPAALATSVRESTPLKAFDIALSGTLDGSFSLEGELQRADIVLNAADGVIHPGPLFGAAVSPADDARLRVQSIDGEATYEASAQSLDVKRLDVEFADGSALALPVPLQHAMPVKRLSVTAKASEARVDMQSIEVDLDGPVITAEGQIQNPIAAPRMTLRAKTGGVAFDDLDRYWPPLLAPGGHDWVTTHLSDGIARTAEIELALSETGGEITLESVSGRIEADGITVDYLPPLPAITDAAGSARFDLKSVDVTIVGGRSGEIAVTGGEASIYDFDGPIERLSVDLPIEGPLPDVLNYINQPPLELLEDFELDPEAASGAVTLRVQLDLPLFKDLPIEDVNLSILGEGTQISIEDVIEDKEVSDGTLKLALDTKGMNIDGPITVSGLPGYVTWEELFAASADTRRQVRFTVSDVSAKQVHSLGEGTIDVERYLIGGQVSGNTLYVEAGDGTQRFEVDADLTSTDVAIPQLGWRKPAGEFGGLQLSGRLSGGSLDVIDPAQISAAGLEAGGRIEFSEGDVQHIALRQLRGPLTDISGNARRGATGGWRIIFAGEQLNVPALFASDGDGDTMEEAATEVDATGELPDCSIEGTIGRLWIGEDVYLRDFETGLLVSSGRWESFSATATDNAGIAWRARIAPEQPRRRSLEVRIGDAGTVLRNLRIYDYVHGGRLSINGTFDDSQPTSPLDGRLKVEDFRMTEAPILARLLNVASLTGIRNTLTGRGISFTELNAPFVMERGRIEVDDARMYGSSLGLTAAGTIDTRRGLLDVRGTLVPFYTVNSVLGRIPVIGDVFSGGEKGGGLFAATYRVSGPVSDPDVSYNPLAAVAPGFLRNLFNIFEEPDITVED